MRQIRVALAQMNATVGDLRGNTERILQLIGEAATRGADLVAFPELALTGYPPEDLLFKRQFLDDAASHLEQIAAASHDLVVVVGAPHVEGGDLYNAAAVAHGGRVVDFYHKMYLPNYGVFDEDRYFQRGRQCPVFVVNGVGVGVNVCEDVWYAVGPITVQAAAGAEVIVNISASPYYRSRGTSRQNMIAARAADHELYMAYVNMVGGQDELVFDGQSLVFDHHGELLARGPQFEAALLVVDLDADAVFNSRLHVPLHRQESTSAVPRIGEPVVHSISEHREREPGPPVAGVICEPLEPLAEVYAALVTGTRDYVRKSGFDKVLIGLSGGIDSALTAALAVDALGPENVVTVFMPSRYTSEASGVDAQALADNMGIFMHTIPIEGAYGAYLEALGPLFEGLESDVTEENIQARVRGNLLMAMSNKFGWLVLTTGNKSEMATGYCTLYGDMAGGFAVLKDVPKTLVQQLSRHRNGVGPSAPIPAAILTKPPSAELRPDQKDEDSLPPYAVLDSIVETYVEEDRTVEEMVAMGLPPAAVAQTIGLVDHSEYKRRQAPPGIKITHRAFGRDRRLPIVNRYRPT
jgi:NAD+ synthase (glutamine-hydrolysing)